MKTRGVLFDYNGVIVNDEHLQEAAMRNVLGEYAVELTQDLYRQMCLGRTDAEAMRNLQQEFSQLKSVPVAQLIDRKVQEYQRIVQTESIVQPGIKQVLEQLVPQFKLAVVTGSLRIEVEPVLASAGIEKFFEAVITADDITHGKPHPEGYLKGIAALQLPPENIVVIEDTPTGVSAAKAAGLKCIAVEHTVRKDRLHEADVVLQRVTDVTTSVLEQLFTA